MQKSPLSPLAANPIPFAARIFCIYLKCESGKNPYIPLSKNALIKVYMGFDYRFTQLKISNPNSKLADISYLTFFST
jgi:hypothetical protein